VTFTNQQKFDAVMRELKWRAYVYAGRVERGKMTQKKADFEEAIFRSIAADYQVKAEEERQLAEEQRIAGELPL
jgi:hypothetical protein